VPDSKNINHGKNVSPSERQCTGYKTAASQPDQIALANSWQYVLS